MSPDQYSPTSANCSAFDRLPEVVPLLVLLETLLNPDQYSFLGQDQGKVLEHLVLSLVRNDWIENIVSGLESLVSRKKAHKVDFTDSTLLGCQQEKECSHSLPRPSLDTSLGSVP